VKVSFAFEWDAVDGHGKTGPGGFEMNAADGGVAAAEPLQAGYYQATIYATVAGLGSSDGGSDGEPTATPAVLTVKQKFGFTVEGQPPFRVLNYTRTTAPCQGAGNPVDRLQQEEAVERCDKKTKHIDCYSGATVWIAAINLTAVENKAGTVKLVRCSLFRTGFNVTCDRIAVPFSVLFVYTFNLSWHCGSPS
jgi:hypothetical protein